MEALEEAVRLLKKAEEVNQETAGKYITLADRYAAIAMSDNHPNL
jgi:hypothetical protein